MKSAFLLAAILSGLCAEVMASPIGDIDYDNRTAPMIEADLHFNPGSVDEGFPDVVPEADSQLVTNDFDPAIKEEKFALDENQASGSLGAPEPPPVTLILIGLSFLGVFAGWRRARWERRRSRRRTVVRMRAITAER